MLTRLGRLVRRETMEKKQNKNKPKIVASLFSGCGGLDLGFTGGFNFRGHHYEKLDTHIVFANDFDQDAYNCYNSNRLLTDDGAECRLEDIRNIKTEEIGK